MISATACVLGFSLLIAGQNPAIDKETRQWIATNVCAASSDSGVDPQILGAYILNENGKFDLWAIGPAIKGRDHGLFQTNSYYQRHRSNLEQAHHPYYGAMIAASIIRENLQKFGWSWKAFAAYWSQQQANNSSPQAVRYYQRLVKNFDIVDKRFQEAQLKIAAQSTATIP